MKILKFIILTIFCFLLFSSEINATVFYVSSEQEFDDAHNNATANDSIIWLSGTYFNIDLEIENSNLFIASEELGSVIFSGDSKLEIDGDYITFQGFQFLNGDIGTEHVVNITGSHILFTQVNINAYDSYKYLRVREESQYVTISYCNFENRLNLFDQNILSLLVDDNNPGYHKVQYCSFKNFEGTGNDMGIEPIRIGVSTQAEFIGRNLVEYCYFTKCDGDGELISNKARQSVFRYNTFEDNPKAELVLRHGSENIVYSNFFLNGKGGVRVREGQDQYIYNNYFYNLDDRAIYLQNEDDDPLDNINIAFNTIINCDEVRLGGGNDEPTNVTFANNIFCHPNNDIFDDATGTETWIGNIAFGDLGISLPTNGITVVDPELTKNSEGYFGLSQNSAALNAAQSGYALLPNYIENANIDTSILYDLMQQNRPAIISEKDLGCTEFSETLIIKPFATKENTGPFYLTTIDTLTNLNNNFNVVNNLIKLNSNFVSNQLNISIYADNQTNISLNIYNLNGKKVSNLFKESVFTGTTTVSKDVSNLPNGMYIIKAIGFNNFGIEEKIQIKKFVKS